MSAKYSRQLWIPGAAKRAWRLALRKQPLWRTVGLRAHFVLAFVIGVIARQCLTLFLL